MSTILIFNRQIPVYGLLGVTGVILGGIYLAVRFRKDRKLIEDYLYIYVWACAMAIVGAKILYLIVELPNIITYLSDPNLNRMQIISTYITGGFVFYGGLFGAIIGTKLAAMYFKMDFGTVINELACCMPLAHSFGRIGCHLVGCCYGCSYGGIGAVYYTASDYAPAGVGLFPVQLTEAGADIIIFILLIINIRCGQSHIRNIDLYLVTYAAVRFTLEFFRGDSYRGIFAGLSLSQWISIAIVIIEVIREFIFRSKKYRLETD